MNTLFTSLHIPKTFLAEICLNDTQNLYTKLKTLRDPSGVRELFHILLIGDTQHYLRLHTKEKLLDNSEISKHIYRLLKETDQWTLKYKWLEIRLFLDEIWYLSKRDKIRFDNNNILTTANVSELGSLESNFVSTLFYVLTENPSLDFVYQKLITLEGSEVHKEAITFVQKVFESLQFVNGNLHLKNCIRALYVSHSLSLSLNAKLKISID
jgi:hypothetical protein